MSGVAVADQVNLLFRRHVLFDYIEKAKPLLMAMAGKTFANDGAVGNVHGGKEACGAVAFVVVGQGAAASRLERQRSWVRSKA